ncbi:MAG: ParB/RepB/Spo0J family partition protein [bacterium]|nr:ParB/RepB/Spo0J family partition protein [bacterium]
MTTSKLGRGLGSLIGGSTQINEQFEHAAVSTGQVTELPIAVVKPSPSNPRKMFEEGALDELAQSIKEHGIIQPLLVTRDAEGQYILIAGERRLRAAKKAGLTRVPVVVRDTGELERLLLGMIENLQREDLNPMELAHAYQKLMEDFSLTQKEVAERVGKSTAVIGNHLRLLNLSDTIKGALDEGKLTEKHARALLSIKDAGERDQLFQQMVREGWTASETEERARVHVRPYIRDVKRIQPQIQDYEKRLRAALGAKALIIQKDGRGKVEIYFSSDEELADIIRRISE